MDSRQACLRSATRNHSFLHRKEVVQPVAVQYRQQSQQFLLSWLECVLRGSWSSSRASSWI